MLTLVEGGATIIQSAAGGKKSLFDIQYATEATVDVSAFITTAANVVHPAFAAVFVTVAAAFTLITDFASFVTALVVLLLQLLRFGYLCCCFQFFLLLLSSPAGITAVVSDVMKLLLLRTLIKLLLLLLILLLLLLLLLLHLSSNYILYCLKH